MSTTKTGIEWCDRTWNPVRGCSRVSAGCDHCYAESQAGRFCGPGQPFEGFTKRVHGKAHWTGKVKVIESALAEPLRWRKPAVIFVNSMSDLFHEALPISNIAEVFDVMASRTLSCTHRSKHLDRHEEDCWSGPPHTFLILTKRADRMERVIRALPKWIGDQRWGPAPLSLALEAGAWPLPNVWLGVSVEDQATADARIPHLLATPAAGRFVSYEPALGPVEWGPWLFDEEAPFAGYDTGYTAPRGAIGCIIAGGESGPGARPPHPDWFRQTRDRCGAAGVAFFFKQWGAWVQVQGVVNGTKAEYQPRMLRAGKRVTGRLLDGRTHDDLPWRA